MRTYYTTRKISKEKLIRQEAANMAKDKYPEHFSDDMQLILNFGDRYAVTSEGLVKMGGFSSTHTPIDGAPGNELETFYFQAIYFLRESCFFANIKYLNQIRKRERFYILFIVVLSLT